MVINNFITKFYPFINSYVIGKLEEILHDEFEVKLYLLLAIKNKVKVESSLIKCVYIFY